MAQSSDLSIGAGLAALAVRNEMNEKFAALFSANSGATAPPVTVGGMLWLDNGVSPPMLRQRNNANTDWIDILPPGTNAEAQAGSSTTVAMTPAMAQSRISRFAAAGGTLTDLSLSFENRLSVTFTATSTTMLAIATAGANETSANANDILGDFRLFDSVTGTEIVTVFGGETAPPFYGYGCRFTLTMTSSTMVVGRSYTLRLYLRKSTVTGPTLPRDLRIEGIFV